ncbi:hypothetical protein R3P38DRAFT_3229470 [Favolaschia claudopus]|uniref:Uncharacterized protein n=1 Tax=Favolaschia claudopus TaxID=2862362 RepID=A0AAV9ZNZ7_9AGAR
MSVKQAGGGCLIIHPHHRAKPRLRQPSDPLNALAIYCRLSPYRGRGRCQSLTPPALALDAARDTSPPRFDIPMSRTISGSLPAVDFPPTSASVYIPARDLVESGERLPQLRIAAKVLLVSVLSLLLIPVYVVDANTISRSRPISAEGLGVLPDCHTFMLLSQLWDSLRFPMLVVHLRSLRSLLTSPPATAPAQYSPPLTSYALSMLAPRRRCLSYGHSDDGPIAPDHFTRYPLNDVPLGWRCECA